jgi:Uma2 family endonuclease
MSPALISSPSVLPEQRLLFPGKHSWGQFKVLEALVRAEYPGVRLFYLDGCIELMTISPEHELLKSILEALLVSFFCQQQINAVPMGSATLQSEAQSSSAEPDLSYRFDGEMGLPELAIEIALSSGGTEKLARYQKLGIPEVWFWQNERLELYRLEAGEYQTIVQSQCLPSLDVKLLADCLKLKNLLAAMQAFQNS